MLKGLVIGGKSIQDATGLGKTIMLLTIVYIARYHETLDAQGQRIYEITVLVVPASVIKQWVDEIFSRFPDFKLIISYDDTGLNSSVYEGSFVTSTAMKHYGSPEKWPERLRYIFDEKNPVTGMTILITSQDTASRRFLVPYKVTVREAISFKPRKLDATGNEIFREPKETWTEYTGILSGKVGIAVVDEAQRLKDNTSLRWKAYSQLAPRLSIILGATPMSNIGVVSKAKRKFVLGALPY